MESYLYTCQYCSKEYKPNRRKKQKYCSNSCRVRSFKIRNTQIKNSPIKSNQDNEKVKIEKMSFAGVGNAAIGTLAVNLATNLLTNEENKPATKKDLKNLITSLKQRYYPILNIPLRRDGAKAYFDMESKILVYLKT